MIYTNNKTRKLLKQIARLEEKQKTQKLTEDEKIKISKGPQLREALERSEDGINYNKPKGPMSKKTKKRLEKKRKQKQKRKAKLRKREEEIRKREEAIRKREEEMRRKEEEMRRKREEEKRRKEEEMRRKRKWQEIPADISEFINNGDDNRYKSKEYKKLVMKYHPDKNPTQSDLYTHYTQVLNQKKNSLSTD
jgi:DNA repair exonuclease SbcCD ATPase subunit